MLELKQDDKDLKRRLARYLLVRLAEISRDCPGVLLNKKVWMKFT